MCESEHSKWGDECQGNEALETEQDKRTKQNKKESLDGKKTGKDAKATAEDMVNRPAEYHRLVIPVIEPQHA